MAVARLLVGQVVCFLSLFSLFLLLGKQALYRVYLFYFVLWQGFWLQSSMF